MSITVIIESNVTDFDKWLSLYNELEDQRREAGIEVQAFRNQDKPKTSFVIGTTPSKEIFFNFFNSPERLSIQKSVITEKPKITFLEQA